MSNILERSSKMCTGCGVCSKICPKKCIKIDINEDGFYRPKVESSKCISCELCKEVCYKYINESKDSSYSIENTNNYLSYSKNEYNRANSSSGGIGRELSRYALKYNYLICGVEYDYKNNNAKHCIINDKQGIERISKSKYIPSYTEEAFNNLDKTKKYIVFGTPCQIYGLRKYLDNKKLDNIILIDFFCHGVPSLNAWIKYLEYVSTSHGIKNIKNIDFRDKKQGWHNYHIKIEEENGEIYSSLFKDDMFSHLFLMNLCLSEACHDCKLRFNKIYSDIRLGDFWGPKCQDDEIGTSIVLTNTKKGETIFKSLDNLHYEEITFEELKESQFIQHLNIPKERNIVMKELKTDLPIERVYRHVKKTKFKIKFKDKLYYPLYLLKARAYKIVKKFK